MAGVVDMIGLGRGEEDAIDAAREGAEEGMGLALAEAGEDGGERGFEIGDGGRAGIEGAQRVDEDDLAIEPGEVIAEEGRTTWVL